MHVYLNRVGVFFKDGPLMADPPFWSPSAVSLVRSKSGRLGGHCRSGYTSRSDCLVDGGYLSGWIMMGGFDTPIALGFLAGRITLSGSITQQGGLVL